MNLSQLLMNVATNDDTVARDEIVNAIAEDKLLDIHALYIKVESMFRYDPSNSVNEMYLLAMIEVLKVHHNAKVNDDD
jgi:hypothetical protein